MSTNRFFVSRSDFAGDRVRLSREQAHQVRQVLRLRPGDMIVVLDGQGMEYEVKLATVSHSEAVGQITSSRAAAGEPVVQLTLFQSLLVREKFEWVLQKGAEVGVTEFVPILTSRGIVRTREIDEGKHDRWRRIVTEAAEQSHRGRVPKIDQVITFSDAVSQLTGFDHCLIAAPSQETKGLRDALLGVPGKDASIALMIGPEGGFTDEEVAMACEKGAVAVGLGPRILRTETAAVVASALILYELGEMRP